jgi:Holliday junction resolvasome RuvABC endonuclease subunit
MVQSLLSLEVPPHSEHAADALAIAICHLNGAPHAAAVASSRVARGVAEPEPGEDDVRIHDRRMPA